MTPRHLQCRHRRRHRRRRRHLLRHHAQLRRHRGHLFHRQSDPYYDLHNNNGTGYCRTYVIFMQTNRNANFITLT